jgi:hypothetical protein
MIKHNLTKICLSHLWHRLQVRKKGPRSPRNNHEFVDIKLVDWHMVDFLETPLITSGGSLGLGGHDPLLEFKNFSSKLLFFISFFATILFEYVDSLIAGGMLISLDSFKGIIQLAK